MASLLGNVPFMIQHTAPSTSAPTNPASIWQQGLNDAENYRNYNNSYTDYASGNPVSSSNDGSTPIDANGNPMTPSIDFSKMQNPTFNGPDAYGLLGVNSGQTYEEQSQAQAMLNRARQFDPNASIKQVDNPYNQDGSSGQPYWQLNFDQSKLPKPKYQGMTSAGQYGTNHLYNQNYIGYDPNYGVVTDPRNIKTPTSWVDTYGPLLVGGFGALAGGAMSGLQSLLLHAPQTIGSIASGNARFSPWNIAGMGLPFLPGITPFMANLGRFGLNYIGSQQQQRGG